jgi:hypothetical protein
MTDKDLRLVGFIFILLVIAQSLFELNEFFFSTRIQGFFISGFGLTNKSFGSVFICESIQLTRVDPLRLIFQNYLNTCKPKF